MAEEDDKDSKTEEPSQKKLEEALEKGQVVNSREVNNFLVLFFLTLIIIWVIPYTLGVSGMALKFFVENAGTIPLDQGMVGLVTKKLCNKFLIYLSPIFIMVVLAAILSSYIQHGEFIFTFEQLQPQLSRISPASGFKRLFSKKSLVEFLKNLAKISLVGSFVYFVINADIKQLGQYHTLTIGGILGQLQSMVNHVMICVSIIMAVIAIIDFSYQRFEHFSSLRMTKHEQKEEYKQMEGSPEIKQKLKSLRKEQAQRRIKETVPKATVVITNPEHYAIALQYEHNKMQAPIVVAKGLDLIAQKIKEIAKEYEIPIVENPPLARIIYKQVKINEEIPVEHYEAVAKIITYVMSLKQKTNNTK
jgi:flagellar biosynthetic protein FlhB